MPDYRRRSDGRIGRSRSQLRHSDCDSSLGVVPAPGSVDVAGEDQPNVSETAPDSGPRPESGEAGTGVGDVPRRARARRRTAVPAESVERPRRRTRRGAPPVGDPVTFNIIEGFMAENRPDCVRCGAWQLCQTPVMRAWPHQGEGWTGDYAVIGERPGQSEDREGQPFVGDSGELLRHLLDEGGIDPDRQVLWLNVVRCADPGNATPTARQVKLCKDLLTVELTHYRPRRILAVGAVAARFLVGAKTHVTVEACRHRAWLWGEAHGLAIPGIVTWHPSYYLRSHSRTVLEDIQDDVAKLASEWVSPVEQRVPSVTQEQRVEGHPVAFDLEWAADGRLLTGKIYLKKRGVPEVFTPTPTTSGVRALANAGAVVGHNIFGDIHRLIAGATEEELYG